MTLTISPKSGKEDCVGGLSQGSGCSNRGRGLLRVIEKGHMGDEVLLCSKRPETVSVVLSYLGSALTLLCDLE